MNGFSHVINWSARTTPSIWRRSQIEISLPKNHFTFDGKEEKEDWFANKPKWYILNVAKTAEKNKARSYHLMTEKKTCFISEILF